MSDFAVCVLAAAIVVASVIRAWFSAPLVRLSDWATLVHVDCTKEKPDAGS
jgi:hypothetical protein